MDKVNSSLDMTFFFFLELSIRTKKQKENFGDNHFRNILRLFDVLTNFSFTTSKTICNY